MFKRQTKVWGIKLLTLILVTFFALSPNLTSASHIPAPDPTLIESGKDLEYANAVYNYIVAHGIDDGPAIAEFLSNTQVSDSGVSRELRINLINEFIDNYTAVTSPEDEVNLLPPDPNLSAQAYENEVYKYLISRGFTDEQALTIALSLAGEPPAKRNSLLLEAIASKNSGTSDDFVDKRDAALKDRIAKSQDLGACAYDNLGACAYDVLAWLLNFFIYAAGYLLRFVAAVFRVVIKISIIDFAKLLDNEGMRFAWRALRDIANLFFIFILLYAAIGTILRISRIDAKKIVINVILVAIFINFSFLISKIIIDAGNQLALFFYNRITTSETGTREIDETLMTALRVVDTVKLTGGETVSYVNEETGEIGDIVIKASAKGWSNLPSLMVKGIGGIVIIVLTAFIIGSAAYMFLARSVILALLAVTSPLAFLMMAFPPVGKAQGVSSKWWSNIVNQSLVAPAYLILLWAVLIIVSNGGAAFDHGGSAVGDALFFFVVAYMLYWSFSIAIEMGGHGAEFAKKSYDKLRQKTVGALKTGVQTGITREIGGRLAYNVANTKLARGLAAYVPGGGLVLKGLDAGGKNYKTARDKRIKEGVEMATRVGTDQRTGEVNPEHIERFGNRAGKLFGVIPTGSEVGSQVRKKAQEASDKEKAKKGYRSTGVNATTGRVEYEETKDFNNPARVAARKAASQAKVRGFSQALKETEHYVDALSQRVSNSGALVPAPTSGATPEEVRAVAKANGYTGDLVEELEKAERRAITLRNNIEGEKKKEDK